MSRRAVRPTINGTTRRSPGSTVAALDFEAAALRTRCTATAARACCRDDLDRDALLLERLGAALYDVVPEPATRHDMLCDLAVRLWRPVGPDVDLRHRRRPGTPVRRCRSRGLWHRPDGRARGRPSTTLSIARSVDAAPTTTGAPCSSTVDVHDLNAAARRPTAPSSSSILTGLRAEPACDLGTIVRCNPDSGDDLRASTAARAGTGAAHCDRDRRTLDRVHPLCVYGEPGPPIGDRRSPRSDRSTRSATTGRRSACSVICTGFGRRREPAGPWSTRSVGPQDRDCVVAAGVGRSIPRREALHHHQPRVGRTRVERRERESVRLHLEPATSRPPGVRWRARFASTAPSVPGARKIITLPASTTTSKLRPRSTVVRSACRHADARRLRARRRQQAVVEIDTDDVDPAARELDRDAARATARRRAPTPARTPSRTSTSPCGSTPAASIRAHWAS